MAYKIFYKKDTLKIVGMCDKGKTMDLPFVTTTKHYHSLSGLKIVKKGKKYIVEPDPDYKPTVYRGKMRTYQKIKN